jgi:gliding motility-associated-like protein
MKLKHFLLIITSVFSLTISAQIQTPKQLQAAIEEKEKTALFYSTLRVSGGGLPITLTSPEQDCNSAIPVCQNVYTTAISYSGYGANDEIPSNSSCLGSNEKNSVWYTFNTSSSGNLAFNINPNSSSDDYDFALYDISGSNCAGIASGAITPIRCNFSATAGQTGLSSSGTNASEPASGSNQSSVLATTAGHTYVLIISNYSSSQSGYTLDFSPGTASIFDITPPTPTGVSAPCGSNVLTLNVSEQIKCSSIASNGSDFTLTGTGGPYTISGATGVNCGTNTGQITFTCSPAISGAGPWTLGIVSGSDGNTLIDACGNPMAAQTKTFTTVPPTVTISGPSSICKNSTFALSASAASSYTWSGAAVPAGQQNQPTISLTPSTAGTLNFNLTVTNGICGNSSTSHAVTVNDAPVAIFGALPSFTVCAGSPITFTNTTVLPCSTGGAGLNQCTCGTFLCNPTPTGGTFASYLWTFGDGGSDFYLLGSGNVSPTYTYNTPGTYNVNLTASTTLGAGCSNSVNHTVVVLPSAASLTISPSVTICPAQSTTLTVSGGSSYTWTPAGSLSSTSSATTVATPATTTIYTVSAPGCGSTTTATTQVTVNGAPPAIGPVNGLTAVCANQTGVTYSVTNVASANYTWTVPAGATITSAPTNSNVITVNFGATAGSVTAVAATACGSATSIVSVNMTAAGNLTVTPSMTVCPSSTITLSAIGGSTYTWSPATTLSSANGSTVSATPATTTTYSVSSISCGVPVTATVEININGGAPAIGLIDGQFVICNSAKTGLTYSVVNVPGATYSWTVPAGATITSAPLNSNSITVNYGASSGSIIVTATTACGSATSIATMTLIPSPTITATANTTICTGGSASLNANGGASYTWSPGGSNAVSLSVTPTITTTYTLTGDNGIGCTNTSTVEVTVVSSPTLVISPNFTVCPNTAHTFSASGATNYTWTPNMFLNTNTSGTVISTPTITTTYTIDGSTIPSCTDTKTVTITVSNTVVVTASAASPTICPLGNTALNASGASNYTWTPSLTLNSPTGGTVTATPSSSQTYTVIGATGTCTNSAQVAVTVTTTPVISVATSPTICSGSSAGLNASGANTYTWSPSAGLTPTVGANVTANPNSTTTYTVVGSSTQGCSSFTTVTVSIVQVPNLSISSNPSSICAGKSSTLSVFGANTYAWSPAASLNSANGASVVATPVINTTYNVFGSNTLGTVSCNSNAIITVTVIPNTIVTTSRNDTICLNDNTIITASGGDTYSWNPTTGLSSPTSSATVAQPNTTTIYTITASTGGLCPGTNTVQVFVRPLPTLYAGRDTTINIDETYVLHGTGNVPVGFLSPDGVPLICHYCPIVEVHPLETTCYTLEAEDQFGCKNFDDICITITKNWDVFIPNAFTPNGDLDNEYFMPKGFGLAQINMSIFDRWGVEVFQETDTKLGWDGKYKGAICQQGVYIYQIETTSLGGVKFKKTGHVNVLSKAK